MKIDTMTLCRLTRREAEDLTTYSPTTSFVTPPIAQGQIVEVSYALDAHAEVIIERTEDRSEPMSSPERVVYRAYAFPEDGAWAWEPWNDVPELGADLGRCKIASSR